MSLRPHLARTALAMALASASSSALANGNCAIDEVIVRPSQVLVNYDPFEAGATIQDFIVDLDTSDCPANRNLFLELDPVDPSASNGTEIRLTGPGNIALLAWISDQRGGMGHGRDDFFNVTAGNRTFFVQLARGQVVPPGTYRVTMQGAARLNNGRNTPDKLTSFEIVVNVGPAIGLIPVSGLGLDLGEMRTGGSAASPVTFDAYANVPYRLTISSDRNFFLRRDQAPTAPGASYAPSLDLNALPVVSPVGDFTRPGSSEWRRRHSLNVAIGDIGGLAAGTYRDTITVEISARLGE